MRIAVIGCGYLGATHAAGLAELGYDVLGVETDPERLKSLTRGATPFYEPELGGLLARHVASGRLRFTDSAAEGARFADVHFLCVGTPQLPDSFGADLSHLDDAVAAMAPYLTEEDLVVGKSTVPVGTAARLAARLPAGVEMAWNPEFLREGHAVADTLRPDRLVFGVTSARAEEALRGVYAGAIARGTPVVVTDLATAEMAKAAANAFLATKVSFINAVAEMCEVAGADVVELADALGHDDRISRKYLGAGIGFGGGCLPKDLRSFLHRAGELGVGDALGLLREVDTINTSRGGRLVELVQSLLGDRGARVGVLGAAFKPESDDIRDSPALRIAGQLHLAGARVRVHDPRALDNARRVWPTLEYADSALAACEGADVVLHLTEWAEYRALSPHDLAAVVRTRRIVDGRNVLPPRLWRDAGWEFHGVGRR